MRPKIALFGKMRSGKDTLADALSEALGVDKYSFAAPLYTSMQALYGDKTKRREYLQEASKYLTDKEDAHFVKLFIKTHPHLDHTGAIIADCRRAVEYAWTHAAGFYKVRLLVSPDTQVARGAEWERLSHPTETALDFLPETAWDLILPEETTVSEKVSRVLEGIKYPGNITFSSVEEEAIAAAVAADFGHRSLAKRSLPPMRGGTDSEW